MFLFPLVEIHADETDTILVYSEPEPEKKFHFKKIVCWEDVSKKARKLFNNFHYGMQAFIFYM